MDTTPTTPQGKTASQETGTPNPTGVCPFKVGSNFSRSKMAAAAEPRSSMPTKLLGERIGKAIGIGGFFRALWNYISNSSTKSLGQAKLNVAEKAKLKEVAMDCLKSNSGGVDNILREITTDTSSQDPRIVNAFVAALKEIELAAYSFALFSC